MQEGRRMFQIFAARMFEQRVLTAYREKVAAERQQKLLEELEEEKGNDAAREAKKAKDAEKRKQKKSAQKQKQAEEKARKEAEKAAQEAAVKEAEQKRQEELKKKREEQRLKKEEQRKAQEAEQARKAAEKIKRQKEEQERRQEAERKAREQKEAERKAREEAKKKEREERENREHEARERKAKARSKGVFSCSTSPSRTASRPSCEACRCSSCAYPARSHQATIQLFIVLTTCAGRHTKSSNSSTTSPRLAARLQGIFAKDSSCICRAGEGRISGRNWRSFTISKCPLSAKDDPFPPAESTASSCALRTALYAESDARNASTSRYATTARRCIWDAARYQWVSAQSSCDDGWNSTASANQASCTDQTSF